MNSPVDEGVLSQKTGELASIGLSTGDFRDLRMSYTRRTYPPALAGITDVALAAKSVVEDPCLFPTATLLLRLNELEQGPSTPGAPSTPTKGIGLCKAVPLLQKVVWVRERPWAGVMIGAGIVGGLVGLGYVLGKRGPK